MRNIVIPVGSGRSFKQVDLKPGAYLAEAVLPSGDILSEEAVVKAGFTKVELRAASSAHEWQSWQNLLGNVESRERYDFAAKGAHPLAVWTITHPREELRSGGANSGQVWNLLDRVAQQAQSGDIKGAWEALTPVRQEKPHARDAQTEMHSFLTHYKGPMDQAPPRWYVSISSEHGLELVSLPVPWFRINGAGELPVELMVQQNASGKISVGFSVLDDYFGTALGYMARGALQSALQLTNQNRVAVDMLYSKWTNPLGAAAGGYILLATESGREEKQWHKWIGNLSKRFPWLPDGAIQEAWLWLKRGSSKENLKKAHDLLAVAYRRGLPYFSLGMQWMVDGLTLVSAQYKDGGKLLDSVQRTAWRINTSQPFASLALAQPGKMRGHPFKNAIRSGSGSAASRQQQMVTA